MNDDYPKSAWSYTRSDYGTVESLRRYWPGLVKSDPRLQLALAQIEIAELAIDRIMEE